MIQKKKKSNGAILPSLLGRGRGRGFLFLLVCVAVFTACGSKGGDDDPEASAKSAACNITSFIVGSDAWQINGTSITKQYPKGTQPGDLTPVIVVSDKATVNPASGVAKNFFTASGITYTVTAEDGTIKIYTAKATVATTL